MVVATGCLTSLASRGQQKRREEERGKNSQARNSYDPCNRYQIIGLGTVTPEEGQLLSDERRTKIGR
jgi:hypothetical protein